MDEVTPSRTALMTAYARAYHQIADRRRVLDDPLAIRLIGRTPEELLQLSEQADDPVAAVMADSERRLFFAARSRFAEDSVRAAVASGTRQAVILGAGLDTFAYRNTNPRLRVFEVDHPATQGWKRTRLEDAGIEIAHAATFVPVDFESDSLADELESAGLRRTEPSIFVWLGVVFYLTARAIRDTLEYIVRGDQAVQVVFDYLQPAATEDDRRQQEVRANRLAEAGEPLHSYFTPDAIARELRQVGLTDIDDHSASDVFSHYSGLSPDVPNSSHGAVSASRVVRASR